MQGTDVPASFAATLDPQRKADAVRIRDDRDSSLSPATLDEPPLRYDVASLQHWIDLNA